MVTDADEFDTPPRSDRLTDEEVAANQAQRMGEIAARSDGDHAALELESAKRVVDGCPHPAPHPFYGACPTCIAAYAQQLRAERRLMRRALEREQETSKGLREQNEKLVAALNSILSEVDAAEFSDATCSEVNAALALAEPK